MSLTTIIKFVIDALLDIELSLRAEKDVRQIHFKVVCKYPLQTHHNVQLAIWIAYLFLHVRNVLATDVDANIIIKN